MQIPIPIMQRDFPNNQSTWMEQPENVEPEIIQMLKQSIWDCGLSLNELASACGVTQSQLSRFVHGKRTLSLPTAVKLFDYLGFKFTPPAKPSKKN